MSAFHPVGRDQWRNQAVIGPVAPASYILHTMRPAGGRGKGSMAPWLHGQGRPATSCQAFHPFRHRGAGGHGEPAPPPLPPERHHSWPTQHPAHGGGQPGVGRRVLAQPCHHHAQHWHPRQARGDPGAGGALPPPPCQAYSSPSSGPGKAALLTGLHPSRTGYQFITPGNLEPVGLPTDFKLLPKVAFSLELRGRSAGIENIVPSTLRTWATSATPSGSGALASAMLTTFPPGPPR